MTNKKMWSIRVRTGKRFPVWMIFIALVLIFYGGYKTYKELTRSSPQPLVFLIQDDYFGPVFFFFGQSDGVDLQPDPLGKAVVVPNNGIVKLKVSLENIMPTDDSRPIYMVSISKNGKRKNLILNGMTQPNENGGETDTYADENSVFHQFPDNPKMPYYYFTESQKNENMVFFHESCAYQNFYPANDPNGKPPGCGKFLVISPNKLMNLPDWMWLNFWHPFSSIKQLEEQANEAVTKKINYYKLQ